MQESQSIREIDWRFPLPRTHTGILMGNGTLGAMIWGEANTLRITINRADFWDHRGGMPWVEGMSYTNIRRMLEAGDEQGLRTLFEGIPVPEGSPERPSILPLGRIEIELVPGMELSSATLDTETGQVVVRAQPANGAEYSIIFTMAIDQPLLQIEFPAAITPEMIHRVTSWEYVGEYLRSISFDKPSFFDGVELSGWVQARPADPPLCAGYHIAGNQLWLAAVYGEDGEDGEVARTNAAGLIDRAVAAGLAKLRADTAAWWAAYWSRVPRIEIPNQKLMFLYRYGMYKFAGLTNPCGVPATLQGPWVEEYQMPPWQSDYHFNINVQMCYWPAYRANLLDHLKPLFDMIGSWQADLQRNAQIFLNIDDGLMLPHAVDDRCMCMGGFWTGSIDHGCTAWVAEMMYRYYRYSGDRAFLRETAYPFMVGAMRVYEAMLEREGDRFELTVSVSPEYRGAAMNAWGRNASFQLACIHFLCESLLDASQVLGIEPKPIWQEIGQKLPRACLYGPEGKQQIALWEGVPLEESHRHHSFIAGLHPFDIIDLNDPHWQPIVERTLTTWIREGMGLWSGWCMPWASIFHTRAGNADMAELLLEIWQRVFTNEGYGTLHDCDFAGFTLIGAAATAKRARPEIMQMDAGMGATTAIMEMLLHTRRGVNYLFSGAPAHWERVGFMNLRTDGAFVVSAERTNGTVQNVYVTGETGGIFRLANPWPASVYLLRKDMVQEQVTGQVLEIALSLGETIEIRPEPAG